MVETQSCVYEVTESGGVEEVGEVAAGDDGVGEAAEGCEEGGEEASEVMMRTEWAKVLGVGCVCVSACESKSRITTLKITHHEKSYKLCITR